MIQRRLIVPVLLASMVIAACRRDPPPPAAPPPAAPPPAAPTTQPPPPPPPPPAAPTGPTATDIAGWNATLREIVFFDYDQSDIRADAQAALRRKVPILQANPQVRIRVEGHADERGSTEYNIALGTRRAQSVVTYLSGFGVPQSAFTILSYGEDRPVAQGSTEEAWARNRRAEFVITEGGNNLRRPATR
jgi:peptidoglycan-associated lipoprotein